MKEHINYKNKKIAEIFAYLDINEYKRKGLFKSKKDFVDYLSKEILLISRDYAGFQTKKNFQRSILNGVFDFRLGGTSHGKFPIRKILFFINSVSEKIYPILPSKERVKIYLFPTFQAFARDKMCGVNGYTPNNNSVHMYLYPNLKYQRKFFTGVKDILAHEYNHAVRFYYFPNSRKMTLLDIIILEGLAENFRMEVLKTKISPWADSVKVNEVKKIFKKIQPLLKLPSYKNYYSLFFENKKFPLWAGYAIGYQLVRSFRKRNRNIRWSQIIQMSSKEIFENSGW